MATEGRFRKVGRRLREGWQAAARDPQARPQTVDEADRFEVKPGELRVVKRGPRDGR